MAAVTSTGAATGLTPLYLVPTEDRLHVAVARDRPLRVEFVAVDRERLLAALGPAAVPIGRIVGPPRPSSGCPPPRRTSTTVGSLARGELHRGPRPTDDRRLACRIPGLGRVACDRARVGARRVRRSQGRCGRRDKAGNPPRRRREPCVATARSMPCSPRHWPGRSGFPARVVVGMVIVRPGTQYVTVGHAWAELRDDDRWTIADAALGAGRRGMRATCRSVCSRTRARDSCCSCSTRSTPWVSRVVVLGPTD